MRFVQILFVFFLFLVSTASASDYVSITVTLQDVDARGQPWDDSSEPDIAICVHTSFGRKCYPENDDLQNIATPLKTACKNTFTCTIDDVFINNAPFYVVVYERDIVFDDTVGERMCPVKGVCRVGLADIVVKSSKPIVKSSERGERDFVLSPIGTATEDNLRGAPDGGCLYYLEDKMYLDGERIISIGGDIVILRWFEGLYEGYWWGQRVTLEIIYVSEPEDWMNESYSIPVVELRLARGDDVTSIRASARCSHI